MKVPVIWLNDYVKVDDIPVCELAEKLVGIGFEVEEIAYNGEGIDKVVVGKILDIKKHADANRLQVCMVDVGHEITTIVTGADNISVGDIVPVALDGASLPGGKIIKASELRGVMSYGMMCSGKELGIDDSVIGGAEINGILILPSDFEIGTDIKTALSLDQYVLDVSVTANRPDCQSIYGIAREVGAVLGRKVKVPNLKYKTVASTVAMPNVSVEDLGLCPRYTARLITDVKVAPSPKWMQLRLRLSGHSCFNNVVDITNFVLAEIGQPLHAFDLRRIDEEINVRRAYTSEKVTALDGNEYLLDGSMLVIADKSKALAIAGVMGGVHSGIAPDTTDVLLEAAKFARGNVRATSRALGLRSDSSARYERGVDWFSVDMGRERALALFGELKVGKIADLSAQCESIAPVPKVIKTSAEQISGLLGIEVKNAAVVKILKALGFDVEQKDKFLSVTVPSYREDVENFTDLTEEVIRYYGYDNIDSIYFGAGKAVGGLSVKQKNIEKIKTLMCANGYYEIITYSFVNEKAADMLKLPQESELRNVLHIRNPLSAEYGVMRTQLASSLLKTVNNNTSRKNDLLKLFEIGKVFICDAEKELPKEREVLGICLVGDNCDFYELKSVVSQVLDSLGIESKIDYSACPYLHPGISADIMSDIGSIGHYGKIHPYVADKFSVPESTYIAEIDLTDYVSKALENTQYVPLPKFPAVSRDLAFVVNDGYSVGELIEAIKKAGGKNCSDVTLFDIYRGEQIADGYKSVAFSFKILPEDRTLTDDEIQKTVNAIVDALGEKFGAQLRLQ